MSKHTKGPWEAHADGAAVHDDEGLIAQVWRIGGERKANARLIAAAPEMYEALQMAHEYIPPYRGGIKNKCAEEIERIIEKLEP